MHNSPPKHQEKLTQHHKVTSKMTRMLSNTLQNPHISQAHADNYRLKNNSKPHSSSWLISLFSSWHQTWCHDNIHFPIAHKVYFTRHQHKITNAGEQKIHTEYEDYKSCLMQTGKVDQRPALYSTTPDSLHSKWPSRKCKEDRQPSLYSNTAVSL